jgi:hypothetical protein
MAENAPMTSSGSDKRDDGSGAEFRRRMSPEFARRERRRALWAGLLGLGMGVMMLVLGVNSIRTGEWVALGRVGNAFDVPGFVAVLMGVFLLYAGGWVIVRFARRP